MSTTKGFPIKLKPRSPSQLRDVPCGRAPRGLFDIPPRVGRLASGSRRPIQQRAMQVATAQAFCRGIPGRPGCQFRAECLAWALEASETGVYGGIEVTTWLLRNERARGEAMERAAAAEASTPSHRRG